MDIKLVLSSDLLARGVDLPEVNLVINYGLPAKEAEYKHRIGRSGRFGNRGAALTIIKRVLENENEEVSYFKDCSSQELEDAKQAIEKL